MEHTRRNVISLLVTLMLSAVLIAACSSAAFAASKPAAPKVQKLTSTNAGEIVITTDWQKAVKGYQIKYSLKSNFANAKTKNITGKRLFSKTITGLSNGKKYYVKVRAYTLNKKGRKVFTKYSAKKTVTTAKYVTGYSTDFILHAKASKNASAANITIPYKSKVLVSKSIGKRSKAQWVKLKYNGKVCYKYFAANTTYFTSKGIDYDSYKELQIPDIRRQVVVAATEICRNEKTAYVNTKNIEPGSRGSDGRMRFDCSGFTSYILNNVMKQYIPNYDISNGISAQETIEYLYSDKNGAFNADIVCSGKPDFTKLQPGDLVFFNDRTQNYTGACDHVGIYIGNKEFIHSVGTVDGVVIMPLGSGRYYERFLFAKSFVPNEDPVPIDEAVSVVSQYTTGSNVYSDIKFKEPNGDKVYTGDIVILKYITPCSWTDENCCYIEYDAGSTGYIQQNRLKM